MTIRSPHRWRIRLLPGGDGRANQINEACRTTAGTRLASRTDEVCNAPPGAAGLKGNVSLFLFCMAGTALSYSLGLRTPGRGQGTVKGWLTSLAIGVVLGFLYFVYSAYGLLFSLDSLF